MSSQLFSTEENADFECFPLQEPVRVHMKKVFVPFGMNKDHSIKFEFSTNESLIAYNTMLETEQKQHAFIQSKNQEKGNQFVVMYKHKCNKKQKYHPTVLCKMPTGRRGTMFSAVVTHAKAGCIATAYTLKGKTVDAVVEMTHCWMKNGFASGHWLVRSILVHP